MKTRYRWIASLLLLTAFHHMAPRAYPQDGIRVGASFGSLTGAQAMWSKAFSAQVESMGAICMTMSADGDADLQKQQCDYLTQQNIGALAVWSVNATSATSIVSRAHERGIPVLALESMIENCELDLLVTIDIEGGGFKQVQALLQSTQGGYIMLGDNATRDSLMPLHRGRIRALSPQVMKKQVQLMGHEWLETSSIQNASRALTEMMLDKGPPNVVLTTQPGQATGAILALSDIGADDDVLVSGFQPDVDACRRINRGQQHSSLYVSYAEAGRRSAELMYSMATRRPIQVSETRHNGSLAVPVALVSPILLTRENVIEVMTRDGMFTRAQIQQ